MQRLHDSFSSQSERAVLRYLCRRIPSWITSDGLTALGLLGAATTCLGYWLATFRLGFLWLAIAGLAMNWLGDSLDGSLARYRNAERPQYGFFLDHSVDGFAMAMVAGGVGLSPLVHFNCALIALIAYFLVAITSLTACLATGVFRVSFGGVGPTEIRAGIAFCTLCGLFLPIPSFAIWSIHVSLYDGLVLMLAVALVTTAIAHIVVTARSLARIDPPRHPLGNAAEESPVVDGPRQSWARYRTHRLAERRMADGLAIEQQRIADATAQLQVNQQADGISVAAADLMHSAGR